MGDIKKKVDQIRDDYYRQLSILTEFKETLLRLFKNISTTLPVKVQSFQGRIKALSSIEYNLKEKGYHSLHDISDLIGIRVIVYLDSDAKRFLKTVSKEFSGQVKVKQSLKKYNGYHFNGVLSPKRAKLPEYAPFKDIPFEIQITTVLYHAWNELEHDIVYKHSEEIKHVFPHAYKVIEKSTERIMQQYIQPAQAEWEQIIRLHGKAMLGKEIVSTSKLKDIAHLTNNNELYEELEQYQKLITELGSPHHDITITLNIFKQILAQAQKNKYKSVKTILGVYEGKKYKDILAIILSLATEMCNVGYDAVFDFFIESFKNSDTEAQRVISNAFIKLSKHHYPTIQSQGFTVLNFIFEKITSWSPKERSDLFELIVIAAESAFSIELNWSTTEMVNGELVTRFPVGTIRADESLKNIRSNFLKTLYELYNSTPDFYRRAIVLRCIEHATYPPHDDNALLYQAVSENIDSILNFVTTIIGTSSFSELHKIESLVAIIKLRAPQFQKQIEEIDIKLNAIPDFSIFHTLVGRISDRISTVTEWDTAIADNEAIVDSYIADINPSTWKVKWYPLLKKVVATYKEIPELDIFDSFQSFLIKLALNKPQFAFKLLQTRDLNIFRTYAIVGLLQSSPKKMKAQIESWIKNKRFLTEILWALEQTQKYYPRMMGQLLTVIKKLSDSKKRFNLLKRLIKICGFETPSRKKLLLNLFKEISKINSEEEWLRVFIKDEAKNVFKTLTNKEWAIIIAFLEKYPRLSSYHISPLLHSLIVSSPELFVQMVFSRMDKQIKPFSRYRRGLDDVKRTELQEYIKERETQILDAIFNLIQGKKKIYQVMHLLHDLFPEVDEAIMRKIRALPQKISEVVLINMFTYYDSSQLTKLALDFVENKKLKDDFIDELIFHLSNPGLVSGRPTEAVMANGYRRMKEQAKTWNTKGNEKLETFRRRYLDHLDKRIEDEELRHIRDLPEKLGEHM